MVAACQENVFFVYFLVRLEQFEIVSHDKCNIVNVKRRSADKKYLFWWSVCKQ